MHVNCELSLTKFMSEVEPLLLQKEACNNLMLGILNHFKDIWHTVHLSESNYGVVYDGSKLIYAFMQTLPQNWIFASCDDVPTTAIHEVAAKVKQLGLDVPGVIGPIQEVETFVTQWEKETNKDAALHMKQLIYQLDEVKPILLAPGNLERATQKHEGIIAKWLLQFGTETVEKITPAKAIEMAMNYVHAGSVYVWVVDNEPVSMVNRSRVTKNGATINAVYTPDNYRGKRYATSAVATLSQFLLDEGFQFCSLYTDMMNPTSNNIYKRIGYYGVGTSIVYTF